MFVVMVAIMVLNKGSNYNSKLWKVEKLLDDDGIPVDIDVQDTARGSGPRPDFVRPARCS